MSPSRITEEDLDTLIAYQRRYIRGYLAFAAIIVLAGIGLVLTIFLFIGQSLPDALKSLFGIGCGFISSLSAFQIREVLARKDKEDLLLRLKERLRTVDENERQRIEKLVQDAVYKTILG